VTTTSQMDAPRIDGFVVRRELGAGGMGAVFLAHEAATGRRVALKVVGGRFAPISESYRRFAIELDAVARVRHPNVIRLRRRGEVDGKPYGVFDHIPGVDLSRLADPQPWPVVVDIALQLAAAITAVHEAGLLHRDIKPANVMLSRHGWVTLIDFGLAKPAGDRELAVGSPPIDDSSLTAPGALMGTPRYLAPEVALGASPSVQSDLFAFGVVLARLLGADVRNARDFAAQSIVAPPELLELVTRCLATDPRERPGSAAEIIAILSRLERRRARITGTVRRTAYGSHGMSTAQCERTTVVGRVARAA